MKTKTVHWIPCQDCGVWGESGRKHECDLANRIEQALFTGYEHLLYSAAEAIEARMKKILKIRKGAKWKGDPNERLTEYPELRTLGRDWQRIVRRLWGVGKKNQGETVKTLFGRPWNWTWPAPGSQQQGQGQDQGQNNSQVISPGQSIQSNVQAPASAPAVFAPNLAVAPETCMGSTSVGVAGSNGLIGGGIAIGSSWKSHDCELRMFARSLMTLGYQDAALALLAQNADVAQALADAGVKVPKAVAKADVLRDPVRPAVIQPELTNFGVRGTTQGK